MTITELRERLEALAEPRFQAFAASLIPDVQNLLGVRLPLLRKLAKEIACHHRELIFNEPTPPQSMEECLLRGMLPGYADKSVSCEQRVAEIAQFVPFITNWSICDSCCATYKFTRENRPVVWAFLQSYLQSAQEYEARFGLVMLLNHFIQDINWVEKIIALLPQLPCKGYYAEMAAAWLLSEINFKQPKLVSRLLLEDSALNSTIRMRTLRKIRESQKKVIRA